MTVIAFIIALAVLVVLLRISLRFWDRHDFAESAFNRRQFLVWSFKGMAAPLCIWMLVNVGVSTRFPPVLAWIEAAKSHGGHWVSAWLALVPPTLFVLSSYWAAATFIWLVSAHVIELECDRRDLIASIVLWSALLSPVLALILYLGRFAAVGIVVVVVLVPVLTELLALGNPRKKLINPIYSIAVEKIRAGRYSAAEREVIRQLAKRDSDFTGWMMLAELYANHFNDLPEADRLVHELCRQPDITRDQMSQAFHQLADWYLKIGKDPAAARRTLEEICCAFPATHLGDLARQRINNLPMCSA
jgi:hypothetical protein